MSGYRICAILLFIAIGYAPARGQTKDSSAVRDSIPHVPGNRVEISAQRESELATVEARGIEIKPATTLVLETGSHLASDALRAISSSLEVRRYGTLGAVALPSFRGLPAEYTTVYRNGIRLTNEQLGETDLGQLTLHGVSRVELIPASTAILLGGDAIGAAINLECEFSDTDELCLGMDQTGYAHASGFPENGYYASLALHPTEPLRIAASGSSDESSGRFPFYQSLTNSYVLRENNDATLQSANLNAEYSIAAGTRLELISNYFSAERGSPGFATTPFRGASSLDERLADEQSLAAVRLEHTSERSSESIAAHYQNQYEAFRGASEGLGDTATNLLYGLAASANTILNSWLMGYAGVDCLHSALTGTSNALSSSSSLIGRNDVRTYAAVSVNPADALNISPSLRAEYVSDISDFEILPQAVIEYTPVQHLLLSTAYSRNFHAPTLNDLYWTGLGNPNLQPEQANEAQAATQYDFNIWRVRCAVSATYFYTLAKNEILWLPSTNGSIWRPINIGVAESKGWELKANASLRIDRETAVLLEEDYTILSARNFTPRDSNYGRELIYSSPTQSLFIGTIARDGCGSIAFAAHYRGQEFSDAANTVTGELPPVTAFDVTLTTRDFIFASIGFHLLLSIQNLTDVNYEDVLEYPLPGRTYKFSIELNY